MGKRQYREIKHRYYQKLTKVDNGIVNISGMPKIFRKPEKDDWWGDWKLTGVYSLELITDLYSNNNPIWIYEVDFDTLKSSACVLDTIAQISHKSWCTESILSNLVWAIDDCLALQQNYCGWGVELKKR